MTEDIRTLPLGEVRNILAGLRDSHMEEVAAGDETPVRVSTAYVRTRGRAPNQYVVAVEIPKKGAA